MLVVATALALAIAETIARRGRADPARFGATGTYLSLASAIALLATTVVAALSGLSNHLGLVPIALGIGLRFAAIRALGDAFTSETVFVPGRPIVTTGLLRWTRHPSDLGLVLYAGGLATLAMSAPAFGLAILVTATAALRVVKEEKLRRS
jgi:protein-S-isoprenylcysteine O-methyltransferase Ste14